MESHHACQILHTAPYKVLNIDARCRETTVTLNFTGKKEGTLTKLCILQQGVVHLTLALMWCVYMYCVCVDDHVYKCHLDFFFFFFYKP